MKEGTVKWYSEKNGIVRKKAMVLLKPKTMGMFLCTARASKTMAFLCCKNPIE